MPATHRNRVERRKFPAIAVRPKDAAEMCGLSESRLYELLLNGELSALKSGSATLITVASIEAYLASLPPYVPRATRVAVASIERAEAA
jgi:excisionase family DNA binding protein